ncbi:hypothetical protein HD554DRAFT_2251212 [Boletus coccyginus]|nr:hypothetical protein HD554DRAFT_2251212 [Boletus coccyginus]
MENAFRSEESRECENAVYSALETCGVLSDDDYVSRDNHAKTRGAVHHALQSCGILTLRESESQVYNTDMDVQKSLVSCGILSLADTQEPGAENMLQSALESCGILAISDESNSPEEDTNNTPSLKTTSQATHGVLNIPYLLQNLMGRVNIIGLPWLLLRDLTASSNQRPGRSTSRGPARESPSGTMVSGSSADEAIVVSTAKSVGLGHLQQRKTVLPLLLGDSSSEEAEFPDWARKSCVKKKKRAVVISNKADGHSDVESVDDVLAASDQSLEDFIKHFSLKAIFDMTTTTSPPPPPPPPPPPRPQPQPQPQPQPAPAPPAPPAPAPSSRVRLYFDKTLKQYSTHVSEGDNTEDRHGNSTNNNIEGK